jgi:hypothetical protein
MEQTKQTETMVWAGGIVDERIPEDRTYRAMTPYPTLTAGVAGIALAAQQCIAYTILNPDTEEGDRAFFMTDDYFHNTIEGLIALEQNPEAAVPEDADGAGFLVPTPRDPIMFAVTRVPLSKLVEHGAVSEADAELWRAVA